MIGYRYDSSGFIVGQTEIQESPLEPGVYLMPPNTTTTAPTTPGKNQIPKFNTGSGTWSLAPDYSGVPYYNKTDRTIKYFVVGEAFDTNYSPSIPLPYYKKTDKTIKYFAVEDGPDSGYTSEVPPSPDYPYIAWNESSGAWVEDANLKREYKMQLNKAKAKSLISQYDWINDTTTTPKLLNKDDFYAYRSALRLLILNPVENPVWPTIPQEVWDAN